MFESLNGYNFILVALNLIILYVILRKILFKPVTEFMEKRTQSIKDSIDDAEKQKKEALEMKQSYEAQLREAKIKGETIINEAIEKAGRASDEIIMNARKEASLLKDAAREETEHEREQMLRDIHNQVVELVVAVSSKVLDANYNTTKNQQLIEEFLGEEGAA